MKNTTYSPIKQTTEMNRDLAFLERSFSADIPVNRTPMQVLEFCILEIKGIRSDHDRAERVEELNKLGAAGWEPTGTTFSGGSSFHEYLIFKRPRSETYGELASPLIS